MSIVKSYLEFSSVYGGQHLESKPELCGRQFRCPSCRQRLVVPPPPGQRVGSAVGRSRATGDTQVPQPDVETPTRYISQARAFASQRRT